MIPKRLTLSTALAVLVSSSLPGGCSTDASPWVRPRRLGDEGRGAAASLLEPRELRVEYGGCATVRLLEDHRLECIYRPGDPLRLWVTHEPSQRPAFAMEGAGAWSMGAPYVLPEELGQGYRLELTEAGLGAVTVTLPERPAWRLQLRAVTELTEAELEALAEPRRRFEALEETLARPDLEVVPQIRALLHEMVERGQVWSAIQSETATAYHLTWRGGRPDLAQELLDELRQSLEERVPSLDRTFPFGHAVLSTFLGHTKRRRGPLTGAAHEYRRASRLVRRTDSPIHTLDALAPYALVLAELGYFEAAAYWSVEVRALATKHARPYSLAEVLAMVAKVSLRLREARQVYDDPAPGLAEVERIYGPGGPLEEYQEPFDALLSRAEHALFQGDPRSAQQQLEKMSALWLTVDMKARVQEVRLRALILQGASPKKLEEALVRLRSHAEGAVDPEIRWKAALLEGWVYETLGQMDDAYRAYVTAEGLLDRLLPMAAMGLPGDYSAARHGESTTRLVAMLTEQGRIDESICVIRRSRARIGQMALLHHHFAREPHQALLAPIEAYAEALRAYEGILQGSVELAQPEYERAHILALESQQRLEQRTFEALSSEPFYRRLPGCDEVSPRQQGELLLILHPQDADLHVFVEDDRGSAHLSSLIGFFSGDDTSEDWQSDLLLHPLDDRLASALRVRVLASGRARTIPVHALPWSSPSATRNEAQEPLIASIPVVYGLDLPGRPSSADRSMVHEALVLVDERAEGAVVEAAEVTTQLQRWGWAVTQSETQEQDPGSLRRALQEVGHFHYAGHAYYADADQSDGIDRDDQKRRWPPYSGGAASAPSHIPLRGKAKLTVSDVFMMKQVPRTVVLMGCATGVFDDRMAYGGFSLAMAFLGSGADMVIASTEEIGGEDASTLGRALYANASKIRDDPGRWMTSALADVRGRGRRVSTLANYRVYVP
ncbi:MAG: CHAT domain-containing protein [Myxococcales bacterium]|nr:CHAT domain-containing protein [Myxococcales bacterium]